MLVKSPYLSVLGIAILARLQVTVVYTASFTTLRLQNVRRGGNTNLVDTKKRNQMYALKMFRRASKASTMGRSLL